MHLLFILAALAYGGASFAYGLDPDAPDSATRSQVVRQTTARQWRRQGKPQHPPKPRPKHPLRRARKARRRQESLGSSSPRPQQPESILT